MIFDVYNTDINYTFMGADPEVGGWVHGWVGGGGGGRCPLHTYLMGGNGLNGGPNFIKGKDLDPPFLLVNIKNVGVPPV